MRFYLFPKLIGLSDAQLRVHIGRWSSKIETASSSSANEESILTDSEGPSPTTSQSERTIGMSKKRGKQRQVPDAPPMPSDVERFPGSWLYTEPNLIDRAATRNPTSDPIRSARGEGSSKGPKRELSYSSSYSSSLSTQGKKPKYTGDRDSMPPPPAALRAMRSRPQ